MKRFSERIGLTPPKTIIQKDSMSDDLRNSLWNLLVIYFWEPFENKRSDDAARLLRSLWIAYFKKPLDEMPPWPYSKDQVKDYVSRAPWNYVYELIEFVVNKYKDEKKRADFVNDCNWILSEELSAYRFVANELVPVTADEEIASIEQAISHTGKLEAVSAHTRAALALLADKNSSDKLSHYRNSIKESISAVEALCRLIVGKPGATLGKALDEIEKNGKIDLPQPLKDSYDKLYGFTSGPNGIRHAMMDKPDLDADDAKFMLVSCSSFVNYLIAKSEKAGIKFT